MTIADFLAGCRADLVAQLSDWVRIRSVAGMPEHEPDLTRSASWLAAALRAAGFPTVEVWDPAAVFAEWCEAPGAPTVLVYSHHDVRAVKGEQWTETEPFEPVERDGWLYGRGASDAKGQIIAHLWAVRAHLAATGRAAPAVNLKLLVEGEEESGSAHLADLLADNRDRVAADLVVFSDSLLWRADHPALCTSIRGMLSGSLKIMGPYRDVHSGVVSGVAPNPAVELSRVVGLLHDADGRVAVPGFYDGVTGPSPARRAELAALPFSDEDWLSRTETRSVVGEAGFTVLERLWERPAVEVLTMVAGDPEGVARGAIPSLAQADLSIRTVPGQQVSEVADLLRRWVEKTVDDRFGHELTLAEEVAQDAYRTPDDHPAVAALAAAMEAGFGCPPGRMGNAGSGPTDLLVDALGAPLLFFGTGLPDDRWHDSDERTSIDVLLKGAATLAHLWARLGREKT